MQNGERKDHAFLLFHRFERLVISENPAETISMMVIPESLKERIERIILEYRQQDKLNLMA